jgi:nitrite reductase (NADH) large subunit
LFDGFWRQVTGYTVLALILISLALSLNKRLHWLQFAGYNFWRVVHVAILSIAVAALLLHTNLHWGRNFNFQLQIAFIITLFTGTVLGSLVVLESVFFGALLRRYRVICLRAHIVLVWCFFGLALIHIISAYYF